MKKLTALLISLLLACSTAFAGVTFDRADDYVSAGTMSGFATSLDTDYFIYSVWLKSSNTTNQMALLGTFNTGTKTAYQIFLNIDPSDGSTVSAGKIYVQRRDEDAQSRSGGVDVDTGITDGAWHHLFVSHKNDSIAIWVDGVSQTITTLGGQDADNMADFGFAMVYGGRNNRGTIDTLFSGTISSIAMGSSSSAPTDSQVLQIYGSRGKRMFLQFSSMFDGFCHALDEQPGGTSFDGDTTYDLCGNGNNGTGVDGANNTGLTVVSEEALTYP